jgi:hypothetical protein
VWTGEYSRTDSVLTFDFEAGSPDMPWRATGTLDGGRLTIEYNLMMWLADFEPGAYVLGTAERRSP